MVLQTFFVVSDTCSKVGPAERLDRPPISTALTAAFDSLLPTVEQAVGFHVLAPLVASMRPSGRGQPRVDRRPAKDRRQGGSASMLVHVSEGSMDQERAREPTHGLRGWQPCLKVTYVYEGVHVPSRHVIPLLILSTASGYVTDVSPADRPRKLIPTDKTSFP